MDKIIIKVNLSLSLVLYRIIICPSTILYSKTLGLEATNSFKIYLGEISKVIARCTCILARLDNLSTFMRDRSQVDNLLSVLNVLSALHDVTGNTKLSCTIGTIQSTFKDTRNQHFRLSFVPSSTCFLPDECLTTACIP